MVIDNTGVEFEVSANTDKAEAQIDKFGNKIEKMADRAEKNAGGSFQRIGEIAAGVFTGQVLLGAVNKLFDTIGAGFHKAIEESSKAQAAMTQFSASLAASGNFSVEAAERFEHYAKSLQKTTGVSDDLIVQNASVLASLGKLSGDGLERASLAALNFSAALNIDSSTSFTLLAKAANGSVEALSRYGIKVDENMSKSDRFAAALLQIEQRFNGLAGAKLNTFEGSLASLNNNINDFFENLGNSVTKSSVIIGLIKLVSNEVAKLAEKFNSASGAKFINETVASLTDMAQMLVWVGMAAEKVFQLFATGFQALVNLASEAGKGISLFTDKLGITTNAFKVWQEQASESGKKTAEMVSTLFSTQTPMSDFAQGIVDKAAIVTGANNGMVESFHKVGPAVDVANAAFQRFDPEPVVGKMNGPLTEVDMRMSQMTSSVQEMTKKTAAAFTQMTTSVISNATQRLVRGLITGQNAFENFASFALNALGDFAIQTGEMIIATAIAAEMLKRTSSFFAGPGPAIGAGLALIAIGAALKTWGGSSGGQVASAGGGGGGGVAAPDATGSPADTAPTELASVAREAPKTAVTVNVQGNILDRRESGLEIAEVIKEFFDTQDGVGVMA